MAKVEIDLGTLENSCFVIMPFAPTFQTQYERVIRVAVEAAGLRCVRADAIYSKPRVMADIWKVLRASRVVIAELTGKNTNVFYEVGLAHVLGKPVIIITRNEDDVPFDLKALRYIYYNTDDPFWGENLKITLTNMLRNLLKEKEYGTVFESIKTTGKMKIEEEKTLPPEEAKPEKPLYNLTGVWQGTMNGGDYNCNLHLFQEEERLSGTMIVSFISKGKLTVVQEAMTGEIKGKTIVLNGVSYSFLQQGSLDTYPLDYLKGKILLKGRKISGKVEDDEGSEYNISLNKKSLEPKPQSSPEKGGI